MLLRLFADNGLPSRQSGFTLIELLVALLVFSLLALMSYRGLGAVLDTRGHVEQETAKWRSVAAFFQRFERDIQLAAPRPARTTAGAAPAWRGQEGGRSAPNVEFSRFATAEGVDTPRRVGYRLNEKQEIELWLWPGLDTAAGVPPARYAVLTGVARFEVQYLDANFTWTGSWPVGRADSDLPRAVRVHVVLSTGEDIVRLFEIKS